MGTNMLKNQMTKSAVIAFMLAAIVAIVFALCAVSSTCALAKDSGSTDMYRMYNPNSGEHFYTASLDERNALIGYGWIGEGVGWVAPKSSDTPVYRLYSGTDHHYTTDIDECRTLEGFGWINEGIGWYSSDAKKIPLYRQFNPNVQPSAPKNNSGSHNYTTSASENDFLANNGWIAEGIGWYAIDGGSEEPTVYITPKGVKYHRLTCPTIHNSNTTALPTYLALQRGYGACKDCKPL